MVPSKVWLQYYSKSLPYVFHKKKMAVPWWCWKWPSLRVGKFNGSVFWRAFLPFPVFITLNARFKSERQHGSAINKDPFTKIGLKWDIFWGRCPARWSPLKSMRLPQQQSPELCQSPSIISPKYSNHFTDNGSTQRAKATGPWKRQGAKILWSHYFCVFVWYDHNILFVANLKDLSSYYKTKVLKAKKEKVYVGQNWKGGFVKLLNIFWARELLTPCLGVPPACPSWVT